VFFTALTHNPAARTRRGVLPQPHQFGQRIVNSAFTLGLMVGISVGDTTLGTTVANLDGTRCASRSRCSNGDTVHVESEIVDIRDSRRDRRTGSWCSSTAPSIRRTRRPLQALGPDAAEAHDMTARSLLFVPGTATRSWRR
jgi:acyl dehydratase